MSHARRKFFDLQQANPNSAAAEALVWIAALYQVEADARTMDVAVRRQLRQERSVPLLEKFHIWLNATRITAAPGSALMKAIDYSLRRWPALTRYAQSGHLPIDNNCTENAVRPIALGRKNWLLSVSEMGSYGLKKNMAEFIRSMSATKPLN